MSTQYHLAKQFVIPQTSTQGIEETTETEYRITDSEISVMNYKVSGYIIVNKVQGTTSF